MAAEPRQPQVAKEGKSFEERTQGTTPWENNNEARSGSQRPDPLIVREGERRSEPAPEPKPVKKSSGTSKATSKKAKKTVK